MKKLAKLAAVTTALLFLVAMAYMISACATSDDDDDSDCAICHFTVTKVVLPVCQHFSGGTFTIFLHHFVSTPCEILSVKGVSLLRAPPAQ